MPLIKEEEKKQEFENLKEILASLQIASEIMQKGDLVPETCLLITLPTTMKNWEEEYKTDMHMASAYLMQMDELDEQQTKYMMIYSQIQVDLADVPLAKIYPFLNLWNRYSAVGTYYVGEDPGTGKLLVHMKGIIGGGVEGFIDEAVICETIYELGYKYDEIKAELLELL